MLVVCAAAGLGLVAAAVLTGKLVLALVGLGVLLLGGGFLLGWLHTRQAVFRCHEWGVYQNGLRGMKQMRYDEVRSFSYGVTRQFVNGSYTGTAVALAFQPLDRELKPVSYGAMLKHVDDELNNLCNQVARVVGHGMPPTLRARRHRA
jgi:hypothetical protein